MKYVIIDAEGVGDIVFSEVFENSQYTLRYNIAKTQTVVKYHGQQPSFLLGKT